MLNLDKISSSIFKTLDAVFPKILNWPAGIEIEVVELLTVVLPVESIKSYHVEVIPLGKLVFTVLELTSKFARMITFFNSVAGIELSKTSILGVKLPEVIV